MLPQLTITEPAPMQKEVPQTRNFFQGHLLSISSIKQDGSIGNFYHAQQGHRQTGLPSPGSPNHSNLMQVERMHEEGKVVRHVKIAERKTEWHSHSNGCKAEGKMFSVFSQRKPSLQGAASVKRFVATGPSPCGIACHNLRIQPALQVAGVPVVAQQTINFRQRREAASTVGDRAGK